MAKKDKHAPGDDLTEPSKKDRRRADAARADALDARLAEVERQLAALTRVVDEVLRPAPRPPSARSARRAQADEAPVEAAGPGISQASVPYTPPAPKARARRAAPAPPTTPAPKGRPRPPRQRPPL